MGFYGNVASSAKAGMSFDITYSNRRQMELAAAGDGVYSGRYVLVEYGKKDNLTMSEITLLYRSSSGTVFYRDYDGQSRYTLPSTPYATTTLYRVLTVRGSYKENDEYSTTIPYELWVTRQGDNSIRQISSSVTGGFSYAENYLADKNTYAPSDSAFSGYDSTVWQKIYEGDTPKYVMIAELNSVVPTFSMKVLPPTSTPVAPTFDGNNTNVFYSMYMSPNWGFRVKPAATGEKSDVAQNGTNLAIYYNKAGFNSATPSKVENADSYIKLEATASSNYSYDKLNEPGTQTANDIQEFSLYMPEIGNMVSDAWDIILGTDRKGNQGSLKGYQEFFTGDLKDNEIPLKSNGVLAGATMTGDSWISATVNAKTTPPKITLTHAKKSITSSATETDLNAAAATSITTYKAIHDGAGHATANNAYKWLLPFGYKTMSVGAPSTGKTNVAGAAATISATSHVDTLAINPSNQWITLTGDATNKTLSIGHKVDTITSTKITATDCNAATDPATSIIVYDIANDEAGHITANQSHEYKLPYGFKTVAVAAASTAENNTSGAKGDIVAESPTDTLNVKAANKWITLTPSPSTDSLTIGHQVNNITTSAVTTDFNSATNTATSITVYDVTNDKAGHLTANQPHEYKLPHGFKTVSIENASTSTSGSTGSAGDLVADTPTDTLTIAPANKWVTLTPTVGSDKFTIGHQVNLINTTSKSTTDVNTNGSYDSIVVQDFTTDEAGHITADQSHEYKLPYGFAAVSTGAPSTIDNVHTANTQVEKVEAGTPVDGLTINPANKWISIKGKPNNNTIEFSHLTNEVTPGDEVEAAINDDGTLVVDKIAFDAAGHVASITPKKYTLPNNFAIFGVGTMPSNTTPTVKVSTQTLTPSSYKDGLLLFGKNRWVSLEVTEGSIKDQQVPALEIAHGAPYIHSSNALVGTESDQSLTYGNSINIPYLKYDAAGHVTGSGASNLSLASPTITTLAQAVEGTTDVTIDVYFDEVTHQFVNKQMDIVDLSLSSFAYEPEEGELKSLSGADTIGTAFAKIQHNFDNTQGIISNLESQISACNTALAAALARLIALEETCQIHSMPTTN